MGACGALLISCLLRFPGGACASESSHGRGRCGNAYGSAARCDLAVLEGAVSYIGEKFFEVIVILYSSMLYKPNDENKCRIYKECLRFVEKSRT